MHDGRSRHIASKQNGRNGSELFCLEEHMADFYYFLCESTCYFEWITTRRLFSILWEILMEICALVAEKIH